MHRLRRRTLPAVLSAGALFLAACSGATVATPPDATVSAATDGATAAAPPSDVVAADGPVRLLEAVPAMHPSIDGWSTVDVLVSSPDSGASWILPVRVADDQAKRQHGFMEVADVPEGTGMLFVFDAPGNGGFWMKNTLVPLDIAYVDAAGVVVTIHTMEPCPGDPCPSYPPSAAYLTTLEVPAGFWERIGLDVGWSIRTV